MNIFNFPKPYKHEHEEIKNVNQILDERRTAGQRAADSIAAVMGSWKFLIIQSMILVLWIAMNIAAYVNHWDPYPFILLNLFLSLQAAYTAPVIMMSQNRQAERDRLEAHNDFNVNVKAEEEVRLIIEHLESQNKALQEIDKQLNEIRSMIVNIKN
ncbi:MAG: DUF1003 domain-containing protein [Bacteroidetes bacterium]|nr:DUF1003 domain-containing protein [Bacteroidota bacterium]